MRSTPPPLFDLTADEQVSDPWMSAESAESQLVAAEANGAFPFRFWQFNGYPPDADELELAEAAMASPDFGLQARCEGEGGSGETPFDDPKGGGTPCSSTETYTVAEMAFALLNVNAEFALTDSERAGLLALAYAASAGSTAFTYSEAGETWAGVFPVSLFAGISVTDNVYTEARRMASYLAAGDRAIPGIWQTLVNHFGAGDSSAAAAALAAPTVPHCGVPADGNGGQSGGGDDGGSCSLLDVGCQLQRLFDSLFGIINRALMAAFAPSDASVDRFVSDVRGAYTDSGMSTIVDFAQVPADALASLGDSADSSCSGFEVSWGAIDTTILESCDGPLATIRQVLVIGGSATVYLAAAFVCLRLVSSPFGVRVFGSGE